MGDSITEGTVVTLLKEVGEYAAEDEVVVQIETDKVSLLVARKRMCSRLTQNVHFARSRWTWLLPCPAPSLRSALGRMIRWRFHCDNNHKRTCVQCDLTSEHSQVGAELFKMTPGGEAPANPSPRCW